MRAIKTHLNKFGLVAAALGMAFGHSGSEFISTFVENILMPFLSLVIGVDDWKGHVIQMGSFDLKWGEVLKDALRCIIIFISVIYILRWLSLEED